MSTSYPHDRFSPPVVRARQTLAANLGSLRHSIRWPARISALPAFVVHVALLLVVTFWTTTSHADLFDPLDAYPPRWHLDTSDCDARVTKQANLPRSGADGGGCELITFDAGLGSEAILVYPIEPVRAVDDLIANVSVMSARAGAKVGLRVRFPYVRDTQSRRPIAVHLYGSQYDRPGRFQSIGIGSIERELRIKVANLRGVHGAKSNLDDAYVDAIILNAYSGPGTTSIRMDQLSLRGMIPVGDHGRVDLVPSDGNRHNDVTGQGQATQSMLRADPSASSPAPSSPQRAEPAFPTRTVIRILEHNGEPLAWIRSLGFDAVLLSSPPTAEILREAIQARLLVYAPPPTAPDPNIQTLLDPIVAWYLGGGVALDTTRVSQTDMTVRRLRQLPEVWQRPIVVAPTEAWSRYATFSDGIVSDLPNRLRNLPATEQAMELRGRSLRLSRQSEVALAIQSGPPTRLLAMNQAIENTLGTEPEGNLRWHSIWAQTMHALEFAPRAILFRSNESLVAPTLLAHQRSMALSFINRYVAMIAPWIASAQSEPGYRIQGAPFRCGRLHTADAEILLLTSDSIRSNEMLAGDGQAIDILLAPDRNSSLAWRLSSFSAERLPIEATPQGTRIRIVSPDVCEIVVLSRDATLGGRLSESARRFARKAAADRWQLTSDQVRHTERSWDQAVNAGAVDISAPVDLLSVARRTLLDAEPIYRAGDAESTLRLARRADAWAMRAAWQLSDALLPDQRTQTRDLLISSPPLEAGRPLLQTAWDPLMEDEGWSDNLLANGGLDADSVLAHGGWTFGRRKLARTQSGVEWVSRGYFDGAGAVRIVASSSSEASLGGGYEGTIAMLSSPPVRVQPGQAVRIEAMIRTIGFGGPHQGVLVHDNLGGQEMGKLIRGATQWTRVRLYRQNVRDTEVRALFEIIGGGEAVIDEVTVKVWDPKPLPRMPFQPISEPVGTSNLKPSF